MTAAASERPPASAIAVRGLRKQYPSVVALDDVDADFGRGEVVGIVGKNGAGKSTLIKVLCGAVQPDAGRIELDGEPVQFGHPAQALDHGIVAMHQQLETFAGLTVAENLLLGTHAFPATASASCTGASSGSAVARR
ncbi:MAG TPA: ATP-binding cassette domain-containing protein, partial [Thermoleophilaceae bacterium]|nr:ATP-binding cassette domain-containing protein [Thermoleophilaceae bacterium]